MQVSPKLLADFAIAFKNYTEVCKEFGLTEEESLNPNAGQWIVDRLKQYKTSQMLHDNLANKMHLEPVPTNSPIK